MTDELDESESEWPDQSQQFASYLRGARALLGLNVKSVARAMRYSDKTLTDLEKSADSRKDRKATALARFYEDLGLKFDWEGEFDIGNVAWTRDVRPFVLCFKTYAQPATVADDFCQEMRYIGGFAYNLKLTDKTKASPYDTIEAYFPVVSRNLACELVIRWLADPKHDKLVLQRGGTEEVILDEGNVREYF